MSDPKYFVFDTETTGLPVRAERGAPPIPADDPRQPRLASIAIIVTDAMGNELSRLKKFIRPDGWTMAEFDARAIAAGGKPASEINGLTDQVLNDNGVPVIEALSAYSGLIHEGLVAVAHNAIFDTKIMRGELRRAGLPDLFEQTLNICTMRALKPYIAEGLYSGGMGYVSLASACKFFGFPQEDAHDAMSDCVNARQILARLIADGRCPEPGITLSKSKAA